MYTNTAYLMPRLRSHVVRYHEAGLQQSFDAAADRLFRNLTRRSFGLDSGGSSALSEDEPPSNGLWMVFGALVVLHTLAMVVWFAEMLITSARVFCV